ncbi:hypothetical protein E2C01_074192 [Portunus trituberculatus]|uniref:Uncharacterized protein n=1 Tax=Portunus trituberculatus TaxID=210409 RepID=A0A5B7IBR8_PORTR|nr:hypothetical protein [Portunus trituberculatus]
MMATRQHHRHFVTSASPVTPQERDVPYPRLLVTTMALASLKSRPRSLTPLSRGCLVGMDVEEWRDSGGTAGSSGTC